jgi:hypothetical protein
MRFCLLLCWITIFVFYLSVRTSMPLYPGSIPNTTNYRMSEYLYDWEGAFVGNKNISKPMREVFLPDKQRPSFAL